MFRPYRDVRFSADKTPYKTAAAAVVPSEDGASSFYIQISARGLFVGAGCYHMSRDQLARYRAAVLQDGPGGELAGIGESLAGAGFEMHASDRLQRVPRGVDPAHPRADLLRYKGLAAMRDFGVEPWLETPRCREAVADAWRAVAPLVAWLGRHVGPAEETEGERRERRRRGAIAARGGQPVRTTRGRAVTPSSATIATSEPSGANAATGSPARPRAASRWPWVVARPPRR